MNKQEALNSLFVTYAGGHNMPKHCIEILFDDAFTEFKTVEKAYNVTRFYLGLMFGEQEKFSIPEVSRLLGCSEAECMEMIKRAGIHVIHDGF